jgi:glycosyltransferase involved in cell wall biosynthesis
MVKRLRLHNVRILPSQPRADVPKLWSAMNVALVPVRAGTLFTGTLSAKMFEAMAMGVPLVLTSPEGEATRMVRECGVGVVLPPEDAPALAAELRRLADSPDVVAAARQCALATSPRYDRNAQALAMLRVLRTAAREPAPSAPVGSTR